MSTVVDYGSDNGMQFVEDSIERVRQKARKRTYSGFCHYCGEEVQGKKPFCNAECRDDYDLEQTIRTRQGR